MTADTHWLTALRHFFSFFFFSFTNSLSRSLSLFYTWNISLLLVIKDHSTTLWSLTGPRQPLKLICSISIVFANYTQSNLWPSQTIRSLSGDRRKWLNLGLSDALTGSCTCASSRQARRSAFYEALSWRGISTSNQNAPTKSQHSHRKIDPRAGPAGRGFAFRLKGCGVGQECPASAKFYFGVGPLQEQSLSVWHYGGHPNG